MKKYILALLFVPFISCANKTNTIPEIAYGSQTETTTTNAKPIDHKQWNDLLQKHVSNKGNVDYKGFKKDQAALQSYLDLLSKNLPEKSWSKEAVLAYWINTYNAYTVKLILDNYPVKSIKKIDSPWDKEFFTLGNKKYSLGEIEHKILRKMNEPRIHFAINCASFSCPNLANEAYTEIGLEKQLETAAKSFVNDKTKNTITADKIEISSIFDWFSGDFKTNGTLIDFLNKYSSVKINKNAKVKYKEYNWNLNE
ncbi:DUF547 domain-containing protein [Flavobacterium chilense]|uniref:DUF547 domain-containing protein n=1 Tax=Flavobacterium chilense TaxID=946677 RepID=A0A1M7MBN0_9FLAO|nr:DUF547 domain-containing protein [Flavobacterium chilense]SHM88241.1 Protein of unknown function, DUF547 [Flavobacterium chilense]